VPVVENSVASPPHLQKLGKALAIASVAVILLATLLPEPGQPASPPLCLVCGSDGGVDLVLNVALFFPLGIGLALSGVRWPRAVLFACGLSVSVETAQLLFIAGRDASIGDVITNTSGGWLGFTLASVSERWLRPNYQGALRLSVAWGVVWLSIQAITTSAFALSIPEGQYYGQVARELGNFAVFRGAVLRTGIDGIPIHDAMLIQSDTVRQHLARGGTVDALAVPAERTAEVAPILRIVDEQEREIVLLAQDDQDLIFGVRTTASVLRLRPLFFDIPGAFAFPRLNKDAAAPDTIALTGRYDGREARLSARVGTTMRELRMSTSASLGWTLLMPFQWSLQNSPAEFFFSWLWMMGLTVPGGYWIAKTVRSANARAKAAHVATVVAGTIAVFAAGLVLAPLAFGTTPASARDWLAAASGMAIGAAFTIRNRKSLPSLFNSATIPD